MSEVPENKKVWTVTTLTQQIRLILQSAFPPVWIEAEISNFTRSGAGHCYFTLKDEQSQLRAVLWRDVASRIPFQMHDGMKVLVQGTLDVYGGRGQYQIRLQQVLPKGIGPLELAFRQLCQRLEAEGLFRPEIKRPIPPLPQRIALITSPTGAAVRDFLEVAIRRWQLCDIIVVPVPVQGDRAAPAIAWALDHVAPLQVDLVALIRGGGSLEDLWAFNEEIVARAIRRCVCPVVTGVGHEIDVTVADLVADMRALTPTETAERLFPDKEQMAQLLTQWTNRLCLSAQRHVTQKKQSLTAIEALRGFQRPLEWVEDITRRVDDSEQRLCRAIQNGLREHHDDLGKWARTLDALSPLQVLQRGYTVVHDEQGAVVRSVEQLQQGQLLRIRLVDGTADCRVESVGQE